MKVKVGNWRDFLLIIAENGDLDWYSRDVFYCKACLFEDVNRLSYDLLGIKDDLELQEPEEYHERL